MLNGTRLKILKRSQAFLLGFSLLCSLIWQPSFAQETDDKTNVSSNPLLDSGFFYDKKGDRYFSNGKSSFSIRPIRDKNYLERIEVSVDDSSFQPYSGKLQFNTEGLHNIRFRAVDPVHNWSPIQHFRLFVDMTPPKSRPFWQGAQYEKDNIFYVAPGSVLLINSQDTLSGVARVVWKREDKTVTFPGKLSFKIPGEHRIQFATVDNVGNVEKWYEVLFFVDGKSPQTKLSVNGTSFNAKEGLFVSSGSEIVLTSEDDRSGVRTIEYRINGGPLTEYQSPIAISDNSFELKYRAIDRVGNEEEWATFKVLQDSTPPRLALSKVGSHKSIAGKLFAKSGFSFKADAADDESGLERFLVSLDGKNFQPAKSDQFGFRKSGTYYFEVNAKDKVGNLTASNPYTVVIDDEAPETALGATDALIKKDDVYLSGIPNKLKLSANDQGAGLEKIEYSYDGNTFQTFTNEIDLSSWPSAKRTLHYRSVDRLGNVEATKQVTIMVRKDAPTVELFVENGNQPEVPLSSLQGQRLRQPAQQPETEAENLGENDAPSAKVNEVKPPVKSKPTSKAKPGASKNKKRGKK